MPNLKDITSNLNLLLSPEDYSDYGLNGLQVESNSDAEITNIALAVDAGLSIIEKAIAQHAQLLIVHHGIFWGTEEAIVGPLAKKIKLLLTNNCALYAAHLPLDGNLQVGNAAELARFFNFTKIEPAFTHRGQTIGVTAQSPALSLDQIIKGCDSLIGQTPPLNLPFGPKKIERIGIVTGSGTSAISESKKMGLDLLITGEPQQKAYHLAKELQHNVLFVGHYASETLGVLAIGKHLKEKYGLNTFFIDEPTGI